MMHVWSRAAVIVTVAALGQGLGHSSVLAETSESVALTPTADAWYETSAGCEHIPVGCGSAPTTTSYPDNTLHVGATGGQEAARAYVSFALAELPAGAEVTSGQLIVTVDAEAGSNAPETATLQICRVAQPLPSPPPAAAPETDCSVSSPGAFLDESVATVVFDLEPFLSQQATTLTVAIVPTPVAGTAGAATTWHVATSGAKREGSDVPPVTAAVEVAHPNAIVPQPSIVTDPDRGAGQPVEAPGGPIPGFVAVPQSPAPVPPAPAFADPPTVVAPLPEEVITSAPAAFTMEGGNYGIVWSLPLLLALIGWVLINLARRDLRSFAALPA